MSVAVAIVDYGVGNLLSVGRAVAAAGGEPRLVGTPGEIAAAERLLLPGVGAFGHCMAVLRERGLIEPIRAFAATGRPFLGICVGMQVMLEVGTEFGRHDGLGLIAGTVEAIPATGADGTSHKIPHIGWSPLARPAGGRAWAGTLLDGIPADSSVYFVHSFAAQPALPAHRLADTDYHGRAIAAAIGRDNLAGCQFHPEKSGPVGLRILANFIQGLTAGAGA